MAHLSVANSAGALALDAPLPPLWLELYRAKLLPLETKAELNLLVDEIVDQVGEDHELLYAVVIDQPGGPYLLRRVLGKLYRNFRTATERLSTSSVGLRLLLMLSMTMPVILVKPVTPWSKSPEALEELKQEERLEVQNLNLDNDPRQQGFEHRTFGRGATDFGNYLEWERQKAADAYQPFTHWQRETN
jgi:hypothetical protein